MRLYLLTLGTLVFIQGCVSTVIDVVTETVESGIELTGTVVKTAVDVVVPDADDEDDED